MFITNTPSQYHSYFYFIYCSNLLRIIINVFFLFCFKKCKVFQKLGIKFNLFKWHLPARSTRFHQDLKAKEESKSASELNTFS